MKTMIPTLIVTKEQIELENKTTSMNESSLELYPGMCLGISETKKKLDQHTLLKNPNLIVNDSVKLACDNLWQTLTQKVI